MGLERVENMTGRTQTTSGSSGIIGFDISIIVTTL